MREAVRLSQIKCCLVLVFQLKPVQYCVQNWQCQAVYGSTNNRTTVWSGFPRANGMSKKPPLAHMPYQVIALGKSQCWVNILLHL